MSGNTKPSAWEETGKKLHQEVEKEEKVKEEQKAVALNQLAALRENAELAKMYNDSADIGSENIQGSYPILKIHSAGRSMNNELADGSEPNHGWFFYKPTKEQFKTLKCHILTVSKGFRAKKIGDDKATVFNQILSGLIIEDGEPKPFMMYFTGSTRLQSLWNFGKVAAEYTHMKPVSIPMFALTVELETKSTVISYQDKDGKTQQSKAFAIDFKIAKNEDGSPVIVTNPQEFTFLRDSVSKMQDLIDSLIRKGADENQAEYQDGGSITPIDTETPVLNSEGSEVEDVSDDMPF